MNNWKCFHFVIAIHRWECDNIRLVPRRQNPAGITPEESGLVTEQVAEHERSGSRSAGGSAGGT